MLIHCAHVDFCNFMKEGRGPFALLNTALWDIDTYEGGAEASCQMISNSCSSTKHAHSSYACDYRKRHRDLSQIKRTRCGSMLTRVTSDASAILDRGVYMAHDLRSLVFRTNPPLRAPALRESDGGLKPLHGIQSKPPRTTRKTAATSLRHTLCSISVIVTGQRLRVPTFAGATAPGAQ